MINAVPGGAGEKGIPTRADEPGSNFRIALKKAVTEIRAKATAANVKLPKTSSISDSTVTKPLRPTRTPRPHSAASSRRSSGWSEQLIAARDHRTEGNLKRPELPEEKKARHRSESASQNVDRGIEEETVAGNPPVRELVTSHPFDLVFIGKPPPVLKFPQHRRQPKAPQFYVPRAIRVTNQKQTGPPRADRQRGPAATAGRSRRGSPGTRSSPGSRSPRRTRRRRYPLHRRRRSDRGRTPAGNRRFRRATTAPRRNSLWTGLRNVTTSSFSRCSRRHCCVFAILITLKTGGFGETIYRSGDVGAAQR